MASRSDDGTNDLVVSQVLRSNELQNVVPERTCGQCPTRQGRRKQRVQVSQTGIRGGKPEFRCDSVEARRDLT